MKGALVPVGNEADLFFLRRPAQRDGFKAPYSLQALLDIETDLIQHLPVGSGHHRVHGCPDAGERCRPVIEDVDRLESGDVRKTLTHFVFDLPDRLLAVEPVDEVHGNVSLLRVFPAAERHN